MCEVTSRFTSSELAALLLKRFNLLIKDCGTKSAFKDKNYIRIAVRDEGDNDYLIEAFKSLEK